MKCMLDTSVFNWLIDGDIGPDELPAGATYFVTHIQRDELAAESREERRNQLFAQLGALAPIDSLTESSVVGISRVGGSKVSDGVGHEELVRALNRKKKSRNNPNDALIAETALRNQLTLISADRTLCEEMLKRGGNVIQFKKKA
jgi:predicted nucleic acid-binding protein